MIIGARVAERRRALRLTQADLGELVGLSQQAIGKLETGGSRQSFNIGKIARALRTSTAFLEGVIEDPDEGAQLPPPPAVQLVTMQVALPPERALARMFEALLDPLDLSAPKDELAGTLARWLPIGLSQLRDLLPADPRPAQIGPGRELAEAGATPPGSAR
jgi:transcriptional regulator with XRE-family HTH domain